MAKDIAYLTRRETFSASHRLHVASLSAQENRVLFGKCAHPNGHGHNYTLHVTVRGQVDPSTGLVMNLSELKEILHQYVLEKVDHKHLNLDIPEFKSLNPTTENVAMVIWRWLKPVLGEKLSEVRIEETENNTATYRGE